MEGIVKNSRSSTSTKNKKENTSDIFFTDTIWQFLGANINRPYPQAKLLTATVVCPSVDIQSYFLCNLRESTLSTIFTVRTFSRLNISQLSKELEFAHEVCYVLFNYHTLFRWGA